MSETAKIIKIALLDLYNGQPNERIKSFQQLISTYGLQHHLNFQTTLFAVRNKNEIPDTSFDIYIASGGPGNPVDSEGCEWENNFFSLFKQLENHNATAGSIKKHSFLVCHSFQLMCRHYQLGEVSLRRELSYGTVPVSLTVAAQHDPVFNELLEPVYALDSRYWQVVYPNEQQLLKTGAQVLAIEDKELAGEHPRALMAVRFSPTLVGVQFHPEADPGLLKQELTDAGYQQEIIQKYGQPVYDSLLAGALNNDQLLRTYQTLIPNFLNEAVNALSSSKCTISPV